jgi:hypothetical protein
MSADRSCGCATPAESVELSYVYAIGRIVPRAPNISVEKEFAQAAGRNDSNGLTDQQMLQAVLSQPQNRYLARQFCYVLTIEGTDAYVLQPHFAPDTDLLAQSVRPVPNPSDLDVVIGIKGPLAPPDMCNGVSVNRLAFDQIYSFDRDTLFGSIAPPQNAKKEQVDLLNAAAQDLFDRILRAADNFGDLDEHRAMNYLAVRYDAIYRHTARLFSENYSLTGVHAVRSRLAGTRQLINVLFTYTQRDTGVREMYRVRVDVSGGFPFLDTKLEPYYEIERI